MCGRGQPIERQMAPHRPHLEWPQLVLRQLPPASVVIAEPVRSAVTVGVHPGKRGSARSVPAER